MLEKKIVFLVENTLAREDNIWKWYESSDDSRREAGMWLGLLLFTLKLYIECGPDTKN